MITLSNHDIQSMGMTCLQFAATSGRIWVFCKNEMPMPIDANTWSEIAIAVKKTSVAPCVSAHDFRVTFRPTPA